MREFDTITAVATVLGEGGISIIRVSGEKSLQIVNKIFRSKKESPFVDIKPYTMRYGYIVEMDSQDVLDEVIVTFMKAPRSFTAEDVIEINCHGGMIVTQKILLEVVKAGARIAEPGEFTKRAFLNGRIDLSQAEAVIDIIRAKTEVAMKSAVQQSKGKVSLEINSLRNTLLKLIAHIEATVDYPEEDLEQITATKVQSEIVLLIKDLNRILSSADQGKILREGLSTVIIGKPNVGKSSLLNSLLNEKRAIVTDVAGTTRDVIEEYINLDGIPVKIIDTAGIRETEDLVEKIGVEKSKEKINEADLVILMLDLSQELNFEDREIINFIKNKKYIVLLNKSDLSSKIDKNELVNLDAEYIIETSTLTGMGIDKLKTIIKQLFFRGEVRANELVITNSRHKEAAVKAIESLLSAQEALYTTLAIDLASIDLRNAWIDLGKITGDTLEEDIINKIFSQFCLGK